MTKEIKKQNFQVQFYFANSLEIKLRIRQFLKIKKLVISFVYFKTFEKNVLNKVLKKAHSYYRVGDADKYRTSIFIRFDSYSVYLLRSAVLVHLLENI